MSEQHKKMKKFPDTGIDSCNCRSYHKADRSLLPDSAFEYYRNRRKRILFGCIFNLFSCIDADFVQSAVSCVKACIGKSGCRRI